MIYEKKCNLLNEYAVDRDGINNSIYVQAKGTLHIIDSTNPIRILRTTSDNCKRIIIIISINSYLVTINNYCRLIKHTGS